MEKKLYKLTDIHGDLKVGRNVTLGGTLKSDDATFRGDVSIGGWLEAPNIIGVHKGFFKSEDDLKAAYPSPMNGWCAVVCTIPEGNTNQDIDGDLYLVENNQWKKQDGDYKFQITGDITIYNEQVESLREYVLLFEDYVVSRTTALPYDGEALGAITENPNGEPVEPNAIVFLTNQRKFVAESGGKYYEQWRSNDKFVNSEIYAKNKYTSLYLNEANKRLCILYHHPTDGDSLVEVSNNGVDARLEELEEYCYDLEETVEGYYGSLSSDIKTLQDNIKEESTARQEADATLQAEDTRLDRSVSLLVKQMTSVQTMLDAETTARHEADEQLRKLIEAIDVNGGGGSGGEDVPSLEAYVIGEVLFLK